MGTINKLRNLLEEMRKKRRHSEFLKSPEGKKWAAQMKELEEAQAKAAKEAEDVYAVKQREAKRKIALALFADELVLKYGIKDDHPEINKAMREVDILHGLGIDQIRGL